VLYGCSRWKASSDEVKLDNRGGSSDRVLAVNGTACCLPKKETAVVELGFHVTSRELAALESAAHIAGITIGQLMRHVILRVRRRASEKADVAPDGERRLAR
jgi:hypothetical protein